MKVQKTIKIREIREFLSFSQIKAAVDQELTRKTNHLHLQETTAQFTVVLWMTIWTIHQKLRCFNTILPWNNREETVNWKNPQKWAVRNPTTINKWTTTLRVSSNKDCPMHNITLCCSNLQTNCRWSQDENQVFTTRMLRTTHYWNWSTQVSSRTKKKMKKRRKIGKDQRRRPVDWVWPKQSSSFRMV